MKEKVMEDMLTVVIPTHNRYDRLSRALKYILSFDRDIAVIVADSSTKEADGKTGALLRNSRIRHIKYGTDVTVIQKFSRVLDQVKTPYAVFWGDDDILIIPALEECVKFLENNKDYSIAHGEGCTFKMSEACDESRIEWVAPYPLHAMTDESGSERLLKHISNGSTNFYSVYRIEELKKNMRLCSSSGISDIFLEMLMGLLPIVQGKTKKIDRLYLLRESVDISQRYIFHLDIFDWLASDNFSNSYKIFSKYLSEELVLCDGIDSRKAREVVKRVVWSYLNMKLPGAFAAKYKKRETQSIRTRIRKMVTSMPGANRFTLPVLDLIRAHDPFSADLSMQKMLKKSSPYYKDFMPAYRIITEKKSDEVPGNG